MLLRSEDDEGDDGLIRKMNVKVCECVNYCLFDSEHHLNVTRCTVSIRNTLFCHFPVTMVTDFEMCFSMYVLVPTRTVCQWSNIFFFIPATTWFKETTGCFSVQFVNIFTAKINWGWTDFYLPSQPLRVEAMRWILSLSLSLSPYLSLSINSTSRNTDIQTSIYCSFGNQTQHLILHKISAEISKIISHCIPPWNSMHNEIPIFYWFTQQTFTLSQSDCVCTFL